MITNRIQVQLPSPNRRLIHICPTSFPYGCYGNLAGEVPWIWGDALPSGPAPPVRFAGPMPAGGEKELAAAPAVAFTAAAMIAAAAAIVVTKQKQDDQEQDPSAAVVAAAAKQIADTHTR